jgi:hypothetical protein
VSDEAQLREKLRKLEVLFAGAGTPGEKQAAEAAPERMRTRLSGLKQTEPGTKIQVCLPDVWSRRLFLALCRRYGLKPYRLARQRATTVRLRVLKTFADQVLLPEFRELNAELARYLDAVTTRLIREEVHRDTSEAPDAGQ